MTKYDYKVVPAPTQGRKAKGVKGAEARFAFALECVMNDQAEDGWEYVRAETLPSEERQGLSGRTTVFRNMLVFRRAREEEIEAFEPRLLDPPKEIPVLEAARAMQSDDATDARFEEGAVKPALEDEDAGSEADAATEAEKDDAPQEDAQADDADGAETPAKS